MIPQGTNAVISQTFTSQKTRSVYREGAGLQFHWVEAGPESAPPLVLVHGFMAHAMAYRRVVAPLAKRFRLIIPDLPGHGQDESYVSPNVQPTIESLTEWIRLFQDTALGDAPAHWVGHSLGANLAYRIASEQPERMLSLTLTSPGLRVPAQPLVSKALDRLPARIAALGANHLGFSLYQPLSWRGEPMTAAEEAAYLEPLRSRGRMEFMLRLGARIVDGKHTDVRAVDVPTAVIWGEHDHILPLEDAWFVGEQLHANVHIIDSGHSPMEDAPDEFVTVLDHFLP